MPFRTIDTDIWNNAWFYDLTPAQKIMFIYLFSNPLVSNIGVLEVSRKQLASTTGVSLAAANKFLDGLEQDGQIVVDGRQLLIVDFISKQTHFGGNSEANKNDKLLKNLRTLYAACPSKKFQRVLEDTYPSLFKGMPTPSKPLPREEQDPCLSETRPLPAENKPLAQDGEGSGGEYGDIGEYGEDLDHPHTPSAASQPTADASGECVMEQERSLPEPPVYLDGIPGEDDTQPVTDCNRLTDEQPVSREESAAAPEAVLKPEQAPKGKPKKKRTDYRRDDMNSVWERFSFAQEDFETYKRLWERGCREGWLPPVEVIHRALDWQIPEWSRRDPKYVPGPVSYLRKRKWNDRPRQAILPCTPNVPQLPAGAGYNTYPQQQFSKADEMSYVVEKNRIVGVQVIAEMEADDRAREQQNAANQY